MTAKTPSHELKRLLLLMHMKSIRNICKMINQLQSQIKQLRTQMSQISEKYSKEKFYYSYYFIKKKDAKT